MPPGKMRRSAGIMRAPRGSRYPKSANFNPYAYSYSCSYTRDEHCDRAGRRTVYGYEYAYVYGTRKQAPSGNKERNATYV